MSIPTRSCSRSLAVFFAVLSKATTTYRLAKSCGSCFLVIALNKIRAKGAFHLAAKRDVRKTADGDMLDKHVDTTQSDDEAALQLLQLTLVEALEQLPAAHRRMIELRIDGHEIDEIARRTERSKRTVERMLQEARKQLAHLLEVE